MVLVYVPAEQLHQEVCDLGHSAAKTNSRHSRYARLWFKNLRQAGKMPI